MRIGIIIPWAALVGASKMSTAVMLSQTHMTGREATLVRKRRWKLAPVHCETVSADTLETLEEQVVI